MSSVGFGVGFAVGRLTGFGARFLAVRGEFPQLATTEHIDLACKGDLV